jgi:hypothetical protein
MDEQGVAGLSPRMVLLVADTRSQWAELGRRIAAFHAEFVRWVKENDEARRLTTIPGLGAIIASALVAAVGQAESFERGRDLAAWLGLVPRQFTTGGKPKLLGISKRGNEYLRRQLIHGARAALPCMAERDTPLGRWAKGLMGRAHRNVVVVAFANKQARIAWAVLRRQELFAAIRTPVANRCRSRLLCLRRASIRLPPMPVLGRPSSASHPRRRLARIERQADVRLPYGQTRPLSLFSRPSPRRATANRRRKTNR